MLPLQTGRPLPAPTHTATRVPFINPQSQYKRVCEGAGGRFEGYCRSPGGSNPFQGPTPCIRYCHMPGGDSVNHGNGWYPPLRTLDGFGATETTGNFAFSLMLLAVGGAAAYIFAKQYL